MTTYPQKQRLSEIAVKPTFRTIDGVSIRFVESQARNADALLLSPWPESIMAYEATWSRLADTHTWSPSIFRDLDAPSERTP